MRKFLLLSISLVGLCVQIVAQDQLATWDFENKGGNFASMASTNISARIESAIVSFGPSLTMRSFKVNSFAASKQTTTSLENAISDADGGEYARVVIQPRAGYTFNVTKIHFRPISETGRTRIFSVFTSQNGYNSQNILAQFTCSTSANASTNTVNVSSGHSNLEMPLEYESISICNLRHRIHTRQWVLVIHQVLTSA